MTSMRKFLTIVRLIAACALYLFPGANPIVTESTSNSTVKTETDTTTTVKSAPPSNFFSISGSNSNLYPGVSGAVQTQILGVSLVRLTGANCERLKLSKIPYDMGMKVAAVSVMCQDPRVFDAMYMVLDILSNGKIGEEACIRWKKPIPQKMPTKVEIDNERTQAKEELKTGLTIGGIIPVILAFGL